MTDPSKGPWCKSQLRTNTWAETYHQCKSKEGHADDHECHCGVRWTLQGKQR